MPFPILQFYVLFHVNFLWLVYVPVCVNQWTSVVQDPVHSIPEPLNEWPLVTDIWERNIRQSFWNQIKKSYKLCLYKAIIAVCKQSKTKKKTPEKQWKWRYQLIWSEKRFPLLMWWRWCLTVLPRISPYLLANYGSRQT